MKEVREQLEFHDHLVAGVTDWKNQIIAELKSDKNIIFIGVHCRNDRQLTWAESLIAFTSHINQWVWLSSLFRRTDYAYHYKKLYQGKLVDHQHFDKAFQVYRWSSHNFDFYGYVFLMIIRSRYNNDRNQIVFLALSDDYNWIKVGRLKKKQNYFIRFLGQVFKVQRYKICTGIPH